MDVTKRADHSFVNRHCSRRPLQRDARGIPEIARVADGRMDAEFVLLGHGNLHLGCFACRAEDADPIDTALGSDERYLLLAGKLSGLREVASLVS